MPLDLSKFSFLNPVQSAAGADQVPAIPLPEKKPDFQKFPLVYNTTDAVPGLKNAMGEPVIPFKVYKFKDLNGNEFTGKYDPARSGIVHIDEPDEQAQTQIFRAPNAE